jgi:hypothetical protein
MNTKTMILGTLNFSVTNQIPLDLDSPSSIETFATTFGQAMWVRPKNICPPRCHFWTTFWKVSFLVTSTPS